MAFCNKCGREIPDNIDICPMCGKSQKIETEEEKRQRTARELQEKNDELFYSAPTKPIMTKPINNPLLFGLIIGGAALVVGIIVLLITLL